MIHKHLFTSNACEIERPFNRHKTKLNAISSQDAALATDRRGHGWAGRGSKPPSNCAITCRARTTRQSQLLLTDIRLMIVCAALKRPDVILTSSARAIVVFTSLRLSCENRLECGGECVVSGWELAGRRRRARAGRGMEGRRGASSCGVS